ncbi:hypothetical protein HDU67_003350 [Dinochytrium kinnereticum]|nr:hypothetical protein HDU67_003350 [Dinochytrium kinnereticum]
MCGRTVMALSASDLQTRTHTTKWTGRETYRQSFNVGPGRHYPVIVKRGGEMELHSMRWGMIPGFMKEMPDNLMRTINAREDSIKAKSPFWSKPRESQRCIIPIQGFFEWQRRGKDRKPFYIHPSDTSMHILYVAGLWDKALLDDGAGGRKEVYSFAMVTTDAAESFRWLHDRMPVFLWGEEEWRVWIDEGRGFDGAVEGLLRPSEKGLKWHAVNTFVNKIGNDTPECIVPASEKKGTLFKFLKPPPTTSSPATDLEKHKEPVKEEPLHPSLKRKDVSDEDETPEKKRAVDEDEREAGEESRSLPPSSVCKAGKSPHNPKLMGGGKKGSSPGGNRGSAGGGSGSGGSSGAKTPSILSFFKKV